VKEHLESDEVEVEVHFSSCNVLETRVLTGELKSVIALPFPYVMGVDASGIGELFVFSFALSTKACFVVSRIGDKVTRFKVGDEVYAQMSWKIQYGAFSEYVSLKEDWVAHKPKSISLEQAAALPLCALTAWEAMVVRGELRKRIDGHPPNSPPYRILIQAGAGGIGTSAIQIAKAFGAHVTTTASAANHIFVKSLGADVAVDYRTEKYEELFPNSFDMILESVGTPDVLKASFKAIKPGGAMMQVAGFPTQAVLKAEMGTGSVLAWVASHFVGNEWSIANMTKKKGVHHDWIWAWASGGRILRSFCFTMC
jgi:NADPH:quinone reductase-like Zn-dependent oxidoreductase